MGEAIITRSGGSDSDTGSNVGPGAMAFFNNGVFTAPKTGTYHLEAVGGGRGGSAYASWTHSSNESKAVSGGCRGYYNEIYINLNKGDKLNINIGQGGAAASIKPDSGEVSQSANGGNGGTTFIGSYLSALGGNKNGPISYNSVVFDPGYQIPVSYSNGPYGRGGNSNYASGLRDEQYICLNGGSAGTAGMAYISWT